MTDEQPDAAVRTDRDNPGRDNTTPGRTLADAAKELRALLQAQRARAKAARGPNADLRAELDRLEADCARRRAAVGDVDD